MKYLSPLVSPVFGRSGPRSLASLGSTGSIGTSALKVVAKNQDTLRVVALAGARNVELLARQADMVRPRYLGVLTEEGARELRGLLPGGYAPEILVGREGYAALATLPEADLVLAAQVGAAGLVPARGAGRAREVLGPDKLIGVSAHSVEEALAAQAAGADYLGVGAAFVTGTKTDAAPISRETIRAITAAADIPVVAIGGISRENITELAGCGLDGVAVVSALFGQKDVEAAARELYVLSESIARQRFFIV
jgi:hypothetical protein